MAKFFDSMIEACINLLSCQQQGNNLYYLKHHAILKQFFCYYVKYAQGVSAGYNQNSTHNPWSGAGQATSNACLW